MINLSDKQTEFILKDIRARGLSYSKLEGELLDHICCAVENELEKGVNFQHAYNKVLTLFGEEGILKVQEDTLAIVRTKKMKQGRTRFWTSTIAASVMMFLVFSGDGNAQVVPDIRPVNKDREISSSYGKRINPFTKTQAFHQGVDFKVPVGTPILATADGIVKIIKEDQDAWGKHIIISHKDGYETSYAHLSEFKVKPGQEVKKGDIIALSGNTGRTTAPHLHYEIFKEGKTVDPELYFE